MSTVLTAESARRAFSMVSLQKCHAQSRAATPHDAPLRSASRSHRRRPLDDAFVRISPLSLPLAL